MVGVVIAALIIGSALVLYSSNNVQRPHTTSIGSASASTSTSSNATSSPSTTSSSFTNSSAWTVINSNATVYGNLACEDTIAMLTPISCPPAYPGAKSPSLNVEIISYHGEVLYDANISIGVNGQPMTWTMWFTNSTIFCVSPSDGYALCPTHPTYPTIVISTRSASSSNPSNGLRLDLQLSNTTEGINVTVDVYNTLNTVNNVTSASDWAIYSNSLNDICGGNEVVAFAVYQGNYGTGNFTSGSPLAIDSVGGGNICPLLSSSVVYSFNPDSGVASAPAGVFAPGPFSRNVTLSYPVSGYYTCSVGTLSFKPQNASGVWVCPQDTGYKFNPLPPATYTMVGLDQWGDVAVLRFSVLS